MQRGLLSLVPASVLASLSDAAVLGALRAFLALIEHEQLPKIPGLSWAVTLNPSLWALAMFGLVGLRLLVLLWKQARAENLARYVEGWLRIWSRVMLRRLPPSFYHTPDAEENLKSSEEGCRSLVLAVDAASQAIQAILQLVLFLPLLCWISWELTLGLLLGMLPVMAWIQRVLRKLGGRMDARLDAQGHFEAHIGIWKSMIRHWSLPRERNALDVQLAQETRQLHDEGLRIGIRKGAIIHWTDAIAALSVFIVLAVCAMWMRQGTMRAQDLILYAAALLLCYKPVKDCLRLIPVLREARAGFGHLHSLDRRMQVEKIIKTSKIPTHSVLNELTIHDIMFTYNQSTVVFSGYCDHISTLKPTWLRGPNGCGKTTLLRILAGLEHADSGRFSWPGSLHGTDIGFLAHQGILPPLALFAPPRHPTSKQAHLLKVLGVAEFQGREGLSAGQRQRMGIAWLFCSGARILLLDEPLAFIAQKDRFAVLSAMLDCAEAHQIWFVMANHDSLPSELQERLGLWDLPL